MLATFDTLDVFASPRKAPFVEVLVDFLGAEAEAAANRGYGIFGVNRTDEIAHPHDTFKGVEVSDPT